MHCHFFWSAITSSQTCLDPSGHLSLNFWLLEKRDCVFVHSRLSTRQDKNMTTKWNTVWQKHPPPPRNTCAWWKSGLLRVHCCSTFPWRKETRKVFHLLLLPRRFACAQSWLCFSVPPVKQHFRQFFLKEAFLNLSKWNQFLCFVHSETLTRMKSHTDPNCGSFRNIFSLQGSASLYKNKKLTYTPANFISQQLAAFIACSAPKHVSTNSIVQMLGIEWNLILGKQFERNEMGSAKKIFFTCSCRPCQIEIRDPFRTVPT